MKLPIIFLAVIACASARAYNRPDFERDDRYEEPARDERYELRDSPYPRVLSDSLVRAALDAYYKQKREADYDAYYKRAGGRLVIKGKVTVEGSPTIPSGSCLKVTYGRKGGLLQHGHVVQKTVTYNLDGADVNNLQLHITVPPMSEFDMAMWNYLTAVLNMGYCGKTGDQPKVGDYVTPKRASVYFEVGYNDATTDLKLVKFPAKRE